MTMQGGAARGGLLGGLERFTRAVNKAFAILAALIVLAILLLVCAAVISRYFLNAPISEALDVTTFLLVFVFFLALAPALQSGSHIEVDLFDPLIPQKWHKAQRIVGKLLTLLFAGVLLVFVSHHYYDIVDLDELSFTMLTVPLKYIYWIGPVGAAQFLLTAVVDLLRFAQLRPEEISQVAAATGH